MEMRRGEADKPTTLWSGRTQRHSRDYQCVGKGEVSRRNQFNPMGTVFDATFGSKNGRKQMVK